MAVTIRAATGADAAELHALAALTFGLACPPGTSDADIAAFIATQLSEKAFDDYLADPRRIILIAAEETGDDRSVGYSMLVGGPVADPDVRAVVQDPSSIELSKFYVRAERHGSGAASALMRATLDAAAGAGARLCWLGVNQRNERAARFYAKHGFETAGTKRFLVGSDWHDDHIRIRRLGPSAQ